MTSATRSKTMAAVRGAGNKPEEAMAKALKALGAEFVRNDVTLPGRPDFHFPEAKLVLFLDGAFWHGRARLPKTNRDFWRDKIKRNVARSVVVALACVS